MHIDWFVFFAQIVNLLILMFLLKKFLFGRIVAAIDAREAKIAARFAEADRAREEADRAAAVCDAKLKDLEARYEEMIDKARRDAEEYRERLLEKAREEVEFLKKRWIDAFRSERETFLMELRLLAGQQIYAVTRKVLKDLADVDLEERIAQILTERLMALDEEERRRFLSEEADEEEGRLVVVSTAHEIPEDVRRKVAEAIRRCLPEEVEVEYRQSEDVLGGWELRSDGHKIAWSMKDYIDAIEERFNAALHQEILER
ncbi:MAG TPA: hypothetical protein PK836_09260 [Syntrophales bacterium]|nr:hypothetical protein [Syntrophales bacterium]HOM07824.1 hypothetical protein [Syntrophales bacterium]HOO00542.1 hypothetical protein [Syntrophales bacterium]HPC01852.1 hypothetical protein [Syntrophales bacterium]HPQ07352.1 hypothetical protein [Syntrophales bacterium]